MASRGLQLYLLRKNHTTFSEGASNDFQRKINFSKKKVIHKSKAELGS
jgi:hypothetical protein